MHPRKCVVLHESKWTLEYVESKPSSFTRSTTKRDGMRNQSGSQLWCLRIFLCAAVFLFDTCFISGKHLYSLVSSDLMLTWAKLSLSLFFLLTEVYFNMYFKPVVWTLLCVSGRQTSYPQSNHWVCTPGWASFL